MAAATVASETSRAFIRSFQRDAFWNIAGQILPALAAVIALPILLRTLGTQQLGVLGLAWALVGYFSVFDLGLGRALTHFVAGHRATESRDDFNKAVTTGVILITALGVGAGLCLIFAADTLCHRFLVMPEDLQTDATIALQVIGASLPVVLLTIAFRGILEGLQAFRETNLVRIPIGIAGFLVPAALSLRWPHLISVVIAIVTIRLIGLGSLVWLAVLRSDRRLSLSHLVFDKSAAKRLLTYGGWITVSNVLSPLMSYVDRFAIGAILSVTAVAYYATVFDVITKALLIPAAIAGVLFSRISSTSLREHAEARKHYGSALRAVAVLFLPTIGILVVGAHTLLSLWLGDQFAGNATSATRILAVGVLLNGFAHLPFAVIQASRRPDLTAKAHLLEVPCYLAILFLLIPRLGIEGAAAAWSLRAAIDAALLFYLAYKSTRMDRGQRPRMKLWII